MISFLTRRYCGTSLENLCYILNESDNKLAILNVIMFSSEGANFGQV